MASANGNNSVRLSRSIPSALLTS
jgi:hypothetical protein